MRTPARDERGTAMVAALFFITALAITATVVVWLTGSERRVSFNEYSHTRSFYASDAGTETAINWLRTRSMPPQLIDAQNKLVAQQDSLQLIDDEHKYRYNIRFDRVRFRPGWSREYRDFDYTIDCSGVSSNQSSSRIEVRTSRLFRQGY